MCRFTPRPAGVTEQPPSTQVAHARNRSSVVDHEHTGPVLIRCANRVSNKQVALGLIARPQRGSTLAVLQCVSLCMWHDGLAQVTTPYRSSSGRQRHETQEEVKRHGAAWIAWPAVRNSREDNSVAVKPHLTVPRIAEAPRSWRERGIHSESACAAEAVTQAQNVVIQCALNWLMARRPHLMRY